MDYFNNILNFFRNLTFFDLMNLCICLLFILIFKILSTPLAYIIIKMFNFKIKDKKKIKSNGFYKPLKLLFLLFGTYIGINALKLPQNLFAVITKIFKICSILLITKGFSNLFDTNSETFANFRMKIHFTGNDTTINFFSKIAKAFIYIISGFILITELGYNLGGLATGLGISSVVIALAAQDLAKSFLAGISIISDKPFEIGDYIIVGDYAGTVEDITFRTTRIRDVENQVIVLPNSELVSTNIINNTKRQKRRFQTVLTLELDTPLDIVSDFAENVKCMLNENPNVLKDALRVYFDNISANGIDIYVNCYTDLTKLDDYLKFRDTVNYMLLDLANKKGISLAYPSQSIYLKKE